MAMTRSSRRLRPCEDRKSDQTIATVRFMALSALLRPSRPRATNLPVAGPEVPWEFREMSGKFGGQLSMAEDRQVAFGSFRFAPRTGQLWRDNSEVRLTPRAAAVLQCLIECAQEIVTKQDLFDRVRGGPATETTVARLTTLYRCTKSCPGL